MPAAAAEPQGPGSAEIWKVVRQMAMLPVLWATGKIDFEQPNAKLALPVVATTMLLLCTLFLFATMRRIVAVNSRAKVADPGDSQNFTRAEDGSVTEVEYDLAKVKEARTALLMSAAIGTFMYIQWGYVQPISIMCIMQPMQLYENKAIQVHMLGRTGPEYARPWAANNPMQGFIERKKKEAEEAQHADQAKEAKKKD
jgi:hypothetical protein